MAKLSNPTLPDELVAEILVRLPVRPICRFKCVSKPWRSLLSNPRFVRDHFKRHIDDPEDLILTSSSSSDDAPYTLSLAVEDESSSGGAAKNGVARKVQLEFEEKYVSSMVGGSVDGLVLLLLPRARCRKMLFNPITLETAQIRDDRPLNLRSCVYGFGYDSSSEDYKIVSLTSIAGISGSFVDVYSLRMKCWKRIANSHYVLQNSPYDKEDPAPGVYLNGCIHWFGQDSRDEEANYEIVCFNLAREEFEEGLLPDTLNGDFSFDIIVLKGCLALVSEPYETDSSGVYRMAIDVFVMREYGVQDSWTKFTICPEEEGDLFDAAYSVVCVLNEDEIVLAKDREQLVAYNRKSGVSRDLAINGLPGNFNRVMPFRGSLLSPN